MSRIRTVFLGTPDIARFCLEALIKDAHFEIVGVVTQPDRPAGRKLQLQPSPVKALVEPLGIPVITPEVVSTADSMKVIQSWRAEVVIVVAFGQILKQKFLDLFPAKVVNLHASLLPLWRGAAPVQRAIMAGDRETGVSLQVMVKKLDAGPVLGERRFAITEDMSAAEVFEMCKSHGVHLLTVDLMDYLRGNLTAIPQNESLATYAPKIDNAEALMDWTKDARTLHNQVRGLYLGPGAETTRGGKRLKVFRTRIGASSASRQSGQVLQVTDKSVLVQCGKGSLELLEVQPESRAKMQIADYLRGYPLHVGDSFGVQS